MLSVNFFTLKLLRNALIFIVLIFLSLLKFYAQAPSNQNPQKNPNTDTPEKYKYIVGQSPDEFKKLLNEWGARKYKLLTAAKIPLRNSERSNRQLIIAAILSYDAEESFEYEIQPAYSPSEAELLLNNYGGKGFQYRKSISFVEGDKEGSGCNGDFVDEILCKRTYANQISLGSLLLLERGNGKLVKRKYFVLSNPGKVFFWDRGFNENLEERFKQALETSFFIPVGFFYFVTSDQEAIIAEVSNQTDKENIEYKVVWRESGAFLRKEVDALTKEGYRIILKIGTQVVLAKNKERQERVTYFSGGLDKKNFFLISAGRKKYLSEIAQIANQGAYFLTTDMEVWYGDGHEGKLFFEQNVNDSGQRFEYKDVKLTEKPLYPNQAVKQRFVYPVTETAMNDFHRLIKEGYKPRALFYANGIIALLEKEK